MDPYYIIGFSNGEACLKFPSIEKKDCKTGWWVIQTFTLELPKRMQVFYIKLKLIFE